METVKVKEDGKTSQTTSVKQEARLLEVRLNLEHLFSIADDLAHYSLV